MGYETKELTGKLSMIFQNNKKYAVNGKLDVFKVVEY